MAASGQPDSERAGSEAGGGRTWSPSPRCHRCLRLGRATETHYVFPLSALVHLINLLSLQNSAGFPCHAVTHRVTVKSAQNGAATRSRLGQDQLSLLIMANVDGAINTLPILRTAYFV